MGTPRFNPASAAMEEALRDPVQAIAVLKDMLKRQRNKNPHLWVRLGQAYFERRYWAKTRQCAEEALHRSKNAEKSGTKSAVLTASAQLFHQIGAFDESLDILKKAQKADPDNAQIAFGIIGILERHHQLDEAMDQVGRVMASDPQSERAQFWKAKLLKRQKNYDAAEKTFCEFLKTTEDSSKIQDPLAQMEGWNEFGKTYESVKDYDKAMEAFLMGKKLMGKMLSNQIEQCNKARDQAWHTTEKLVESLDADRIRDWIGRGSIGKSQRFGLLTGHPRSGTTLLEQVLDAHSDLVSGDETLVFSEQVVKPLANKLWRGRQRNSPLDLDNLDRLSESELNRIRLAYKRHAEMASSQPIGGSFMLDKNPALITSLPYLFKAYPEARLIVALRDPRNVVLSAFQLWVGVNTWSVNWLSLKDTLENYSRAMGVWTRLRELLPEEAWMEVKYEDVVDDLNKEGKRATDFLGLQWEPAQERYHEHARKKRVASPTYAAVTEKVYRRALDKWHNYESHFEPLLEKFQPWLEAFNYK